MLVLKFLSHIRLHLVDVTLFSSLHLVALCCAWWWTNLQMMWAIVPRDPVRAHISSMHLRLILLGPPSTRKISPAAVLHGLRGLVQSPERETLI